MLKYSLIFAAGAVAGVAVYRLAKTEERCCSLVADAALEKAKSKLGDLFA